MSDEERLTPEEESALSALARKEGPGADLEDRVVAALRRRGLLERPGGWFGWRLVAAAAAAVVFFAGGYVVGRTSTEEADVGRVESVAVPKDAAAERGATQVVWF